MAMTNDSYALMGIGCLLLRFMAIYSGDRGRKGDQVFYNVLMFLVIASAFVRELIAHQTGVS